MKVMAIDIETDVDPRGFFPRSELNPIITIGIRIKEDGEWDPPYSFAADTHDYDGDILVKLLKEVDKEDPDTITGFNIRDFDLPYIVDRLRANQLSPEGLGRGGFEEAHSFRVGASGKESMYRDITLGERVVFDTYTHWAAQDDKLYGLPNRKLKTLARHFAPRETWLDGDYNRMRELVGSEELQAYIISDMRATSLMFDIYFPVFSSVVESLENIWGEGVVTLKEICENTKGFLGRKVCQICCERTGIAFEGTNKDRWGDVATEKQAAITNTFIPNVLFRDPVHLDFSSMYPSIIMTFNISPETTSIVGFEELGEFSAKKDLMTGDILYAIPDEKLNKNVMIRVSGKEGELPKLYKYLNGRRNVIKEELKALTYGTPEYLEKDTEQSAIKMVLNSGTGYMGEIHAKFADVAQYILIVGIGRELFRRLVSHIEHRSFSDLMDDYNRVNAKRHPKFDGSLSPFRYVIEGDTDGIYLNTPPDLDWVNDFLNKLVLEEMRGSGDNYMKLGVDHYDAIYCPNYKGKNYILAKDGALRFKGVAFKSSRLPPAFREARDQFAKAKMLGVGDPKEIYRLWQTFLKGTDKLEPFIMNISVRPPLSYAKNCLPKTIAEQAVERFRMEIKDSQSYSYVKIRGQYWIVTAGDEMKDLPGLIDRDYYLQAIDKIVARLGMENVVMETKQASLMTGWSV
jgi:DNA polymerase elongation subunit (family B)